MSSFLLHPLGFIFFTIVVKATFSEAFEITVQVKLAGKELLDPILQLLGWLVPVPLISGHKRQDGTYICLLGLP